MNLNIWAYLGIAVVVAGVGGGIIWKIKDSGRQEVLIEQQKKLEVIKDKTHDAQINALTTDDPRNELRKYARPND